MTSCDIDNIVAERDDAASAGADFVHFCCFCAVRKSRYMYAGKLAYNNLVLGLSRLQFFFLSGLHIQILAYPNNTGNEANV